MRGVWKIKWDPYDTDSYFRRYPHTHFLLKVRLAELTSVEEKCTDLTNRLVQEKSEHEQLKITSTKAKRLDEEKYAELLKEFKESERERKNLQSELKEAVRRRGWENAILQRMSSFDESLGGINAYIEQKKNKQWFSGIRGGAAQLASGIVRDGTREVVGEAIDNVVE